MISFLDGKIELKTENYVVINVSGVGYKVFLTGPIIAKVGLAGNRIKLFIHYHLRENALNLYGFLDLEELEFFELLISISGIGPKTALSVMALASVKTLKQAISSGQKSLLTKVSGIGKKTAERVILELSNKIDVPIGEVKQLTMDSQAIDALVSLGYTVRQAREALEQVPQKIIKVEERLKQALKVLGKR